MTQEHLSALLISNGNYWRGNLEEFLKGRHVNFGNLQDCGQLASALDRSQPQVIITATELPDGTWRDIVSVVKKAAAPSSIIVVAEDRASRPYLSAAIDYGVFDFVHPPFESEIQACVIHAAARSARRRRREVQPLATLKFRV